MEKYEQYLKDLPIIPVVATKIISIPEEDKNISFADVAKLIQVDPGLTTKVLKVANSAMYARQREITTLQMAITLLGFKNIKSLIIFTAAANMFSKHKNAPFYKIFWRHSVLTAFISREVAAKEIPNISREEAFVAGLLHDIGKVALYHVRTEEYEVLLREKERTGASTSSLEKSTFGASHKEIGDSVLHHWNFPDLYVDTAREHGRENITSEHRSMILCISIADILADKISDIGVSESREILLDRLLTLMGIGKEKIEYYKTTFIDTLLKDSFFQECQNMFHFTFKGPAPPPHYADITHP